MRTQKLPLPGAENSVRSSERSQTNEACLGTKPQPTAAAARVSLLSTTNWIQRLFAIYGVAGIFRLFIAKVIGFTIWLTPSRRRARAAARERDLEFDRNYGVDTSGMMIPDEWEVIGSSWIYGSRYQAVDANALGQVLIELAIDLQQFTFIDFGSGKGRAVLMASQFPFRKVIGVEYSKRLNDIARHNLAAFRKQHQMHCTDIDLICDDALNFPIPDGPLIVFLYNPFGHAVMSELARRISTSFEQGRRRVVVLYFHAVHADVWRNSGFLDEVRASMPVSIYDSRDRNPSEWTGSLSNRRITDEPSVVLSRGAAAI